MLKLEESRIVKILLSMQMVSFSQRIREVVPQHTLEWQFFRALMKSAKLWFPIICGRGGVPRSSTRGAPGWSALQAQKHHCSRGQVGVPPWRGLKWVNELVVFTRTGDVVLGLSPCVFRTKLLGLLPLPPLFPGGGGSLCLVLSLSSLVIWTKDSVSNT